MVVREDPRLKGVKAELSKLMVMSDKNIGSISKETGINTNTLYLRFRDIGSMRLSELLPFLDCVGGRIEIRGE